MQDALVPQLFSILYAGNHSGQNIRLIAYNATIWTGDDKVVEADNKDALFSYAVFVQRHSSSTNSALPSCQWCSQIHVADVFF